MLARLSSRLCVESCLISVESMERRFIFVDPDWVINRDVNNWAQGLLWRWED